VKALSYCSGDIGDKHRLVQTYFKPINREIGSIQAPIRTVDKLMHALQQEARLRSLRFASAAIKPSHSVRLSTAHEKKKL